MIDSTGNTLTGYRPATAPATCRNGHVKTRYNTYHSKAGHERCRDCRRKHKPLKVRTCPGCGDMFAGKGKRCLACVALSHMTTLEDAKTPIRTRMCTECQEVHPLDAFRLEVADYREKGVPRYSDRCQECREESGDAPPSSPDGRAVQQIVRIFGPEAREWINRPGHVLHDLWFIRMLAIQHAIARAHHEKLVRPDIDTRVRNLFPRLREFLRRPPTPATLTLRAA